MRTAVRTFSQRLLERLVAFRAGRPVAHFAEDVPQAGRRLQQRTSHCWPCAATTRRGGGALGGRAEEQDDPMKEAGSQSGRGGGRAGWHRG